MKWGSFGPVHIATLIIAALTLIGLYYLLRNTAAKTQRMVLGCLSLTGIAAIIFNLVRWGSPLEYLPLHLCSINAILLPIAVLTCSKVLGNMLLVWCLGALAAIVVNTEMASADIFSDSFFFYYVPHVFEFGVPLLLFKFKLIPKDFHCIVPTLALTMAIYTFVHVANKLVNRICRELEIVDGSGELVEVNYMFSLSPANPVLELFYDILPLEYWYMYLVVPIVAVYLVIVYAPQILAARRARRVRNANTPIAGKL